MKMEKSQQTTQKYKRSLRHYYEQLHVNKMDNLEEMDKFLEKYNFPTEPGRNRKYSQAHHKHRN